MFDDVVTLLADRLSTRFLAANVTDEDPSTLRTSSILAAPASVTALAEALDDPARSGTVLELLRSAVPVGLPSSATLADIWKDPIAANSATDLLFGGRRDRVVTAISAETGVSEGSSGHVVTLSVLAVFATLAKQFGQADQYTIAAALEDERHEMSARGWDLWLNTAMGSAPVGASWPADSPSPTQTAELALPLLAGEPGQTQGPTSHTSIEPVPPQVPGNGVASRLADRPEPPPLPASSPAPPSAPGRPPALETSTPSTGPAELPSGGSDRGLPSGHASATGLPADSNQEPAPADRSPNSGPSLPPGLLPNAGSGPPSVLPPEPDLGRPTAPPPDRRPGHTTPRPASTNQQVPAPQAAMSHETAPEVPRSAVPNPERDQQVAANPRSNFADVAPPASVPPIPQFERPTTSDSSRGDEAVRVMGGALLVLGVLVAIGLLQYWRANDDGGTAATSAEQATTDGSTTDQNTTDGSTTDEGDGTGSGDGSVAEDGADGEEAAAPSAGSDAEDDSTDGTQAPSAEQREFAIPMIDPLQRADASGMADIMLDADAEEVCWGVEASGMGSPYDGHIHVGPAGVKGGIVVDFGPVENGEMSCIGVARNDIQAILAEPAGYYVEMHDPSGDFTIRAQLSDDPLPAPPDGELEFDPDGDGAVTKISAGQILLEGPVPDQETMDRLVFEVSGLDESRILVVNDLVIDENADRPSGLITVDDAVLFAVDSADIEADSTVIEDLALLFTTRSDWVMTITGHTDSAGDDVYNLELSLARAAAVRDALVELGVEAERLRTVGAGDTSPVAPNDTEEGRQLNRRIEFRVDRS